MRSGEALHRRHLRWALQFCQPDLNESDDYLKDVKTKIYEFIGDANLQAPGKHVRTFILPEVREYVGKLETDDIREIHQILRNGFSAVSENAAFGLGISPGQGNTVNISVDALTPFDRFYQSIVIYLSPTSQSLLALQLHLVRSGLTGEQIRKCSECGTIFIGERKGQKYCSTACARAVANKGYYQREKEVFTKVDVRFKTPATPAPSPKKPATKERRAPVKKGKFKR